jgi:hypothetical protein
MVSRVADVAVLALRHAGAYTELVRCDIDEAWRAAARRALVVSVTAGALLLCASMICVAIVGLAWPTLARYWAIGGLALFFGVIALLGVLQLRVAQATAPRFLERTAREWVKDRALVEEMLGRPPGTTA